MHSVANRKNLVELRRKLLALTERPRLQPRLKSRCVINGLRISIKLGTIFRTAFRPVIHKSEVFDNKYGVPFPGADKSVVFRTQTYLYNKYKLRPVQYNPYFICANLMVVFGFSLMGSILVALCQFGLGRRLLLRVMRILNLVVNYNNWI